MEWNRDTPSSHPIRPLTDTTTPAARTALWSLPSWRHTLLATGLTQMYGLRYGTLPLVCKVGGLAR